MRLSLCVVIVVGIVAIGVDRLGRQLRRLGLSKTQITDMMETSASDEPAPPPPRTPGANVAAEIDWVKATFLEAVVDATGSPRCPIDGSECYEVRIAPIGALLDAGRKKRTSALRRLRTALDPDREARAKFELTIFFRLPPSYPGKAGAQLRITSSNGFAKRDVRALEARLRTLAQRSRQRSQPALKAICRRALRFVSDPDDALRTKPISTWFLIGLGVALLFLFKYVAWRLEHTTTVYHR